MTLRILSGGAAQGLILRLAPAFTLSSGHDIVGTYGAVGTMRDKLTAGEPADLVVLSRTLVLELERSGHVQPGSVIDIGTVATGVAVRTGDHPPDVSTADGLRAALLAADAIFLPDPVKATAGIHVAGVLSKLGIADVTAPRLRAYPNGNAAMTAMAVHCGGTAIGSTQVTEILATPGVTLIGLLPEPMGLATTYTAGVTSSSPNKDAARAFAEALASGAATSDRSAVGFT